MFHERSSEAARRYFAFEKSHVPGAAVSLWGSPYKKKSSNTHLKPALIPDGTPTFEFNTFFRGWQAGHYVVRWRVKLKGNFSVPGGLHFRVDVNYGAEEDATSSLDVVMPHDELKKPDSLDNECTYDLELEDLVVVQPQLNRGGAMVVVAMSNFGSVNDAHAGLQVEYVELSPFSGFNQSAENGISKHVVRSTTGPKFTISLMESSVFGGDVDPTTVQPAISIARLAWSKDGTFLAALALWNNTAYICVWDMKHWDPSKPKNTTIQENCAVTTIKQGTNLKNLSIGLAISADGSQISVYQEPMIGDWSDGSTPTGSTFQFRLLIREQDISESTEDTPAQNQDVLVDMEAKGLSNANMVSTASEPLVINSPPGSHPPRSNNISATTAPQVLVSKKQTNQVYKKFDSPHLMLKNFVGYGAFLNEARNNDWDMTDFSVTQPVNENVKVDTKRQDTNRKFTLPDLIKQPKQPAPSNMLFAACNGIYLDILKIRPRETWVHTHSIRITDLTPTISRRITCKMMMDSISRNTFMWLEDGGVCCMLWDLQKGSNLSYLYSPDNARLASPIFRGNSTMSISPDESMVALANVDGCLITFYASTGLVISKRKFHDHQIEYVGFNGQNKQLFVIVRHNMTHLLESWILDPLRLNSGIKACRVPVPVIGRTIHASFRGESLGSKGLVCKANGGEIHCHITHEPAINTVDRIEGNIVDTERFYPIINSDLHTETKDGQNAGNKNDHSEHSAEIKGDQKAGTKNDHSVETKGDRRTEIKNDHRTEATVEHKTGTKAGGKHGHKAGKQNHKAGAKDHHKVETEHDQGAETKDSSKAKTENVHATVAGNEHKEESQQKPPEQPKAYKRYEVRTAADMKLSRDEEDSTYWALRVDVVEKTDNQKEKVIFSFVPEPWMRISVTKVRHPEEHQKVYFMPGGKRFVVVGIQTLQIWSFSSNGNNNYFNLVFFWSRPKVDTDLENPNGKTATDSERTDKKPSPDLNKPRIDPVASPDAEPSNDPEKSGSGAAANPKKPDAEPSIGLGKPDNEVAVSPEKPDAQSSINPEKLQSATAGNPPNPGAQPPTGPEEAADSGNPDGKGVDSGKTKKAIETELVGEYYHRIRNSHIHLDVKTEEAEAHIKLKGGSGTDIVRIPSEHSRDIHFIFLHCAQSIHLLAAAYTFSIQESKKFPKNLEKSLTLTEHAEAIVRFTHGHINRLLLRKHLRPKLLIEKDMPIHTTSDQVSAQAPKKAPKKALMKAVQALEKVVAKAPGQALEKIPTTAPGQAPEKESAGAPEQASEKASVKSPEQAKAHDRGTNDPPPSLNRHPSMQQGSPIPPGPPSLNRHPSMQQGSPIPPDKILMVLGGGPPTDQKSRVTSHDSSISSTSATEVPCKKGIFSFLIDTVDTQKEKFLPQKDEDTSSEDIFTVLTLLLDQDDLNDANHIFIEGLFTSTKHEWVPHPNVALNPIDRVINIRNEQLLKVLIEYCVNNAKEYHPGYLTPVIQCLSELSERYPEVMSDLFRKASYIRARNPDYVVSHAIVANLGFSDWINFLLRFYTLGIFNRRLFGFTKSSDISQYTNPTFSVRSQLPFYSHVGVGIIFDLIVRRQITFPPEREAQSVVSLSKDIYVSPFQFKPIGGRDGQDRSFLAEIAGKDFFGGPAIEASLWFKWNKSGLYFWSVHFMVLLTFFILVLTITGRQIEVSKLPTDGSAPTEAQIAARYLPGWQPVFYFTIVIGFILVLYELMQMASSKLKYFLSPFNYVHLAAYFSAITGCFIFLNAKPGVREDTGVDGGPSQVWVLAFAILLLYLNIIFELRIIKPLGRAVNIIVNITKKIIWFLLIFAVFLMSFTHALLYVLHTRRYRPCKDGQPDDPCKGGDYPSKYPTNFFEALSTTYFFMSGRYGPVEESFDHGTVGFRFMMVLFFLFTVILLLNVLIALMNDAFNMSETEGERTYWKLLSEVIAELELITSYNERMSGGESYSQYIYYCASEEEVKKFQSSADISGVVQSSKAAHNETHLAQRMIIKGISEVKSEVKDTNIHVKEELKKLVEETMQKEFGELKNLIQQLKLSKE